MAKIVLTSVYAQRYFTCLRIKLNLAYTVPQRVRYPPPLGVGKGAGKPKDYRAVQKENVAYTGPYGVRYEHPVGVLICA